MEVNIAVMQRDQATLQRDVDQITRTLVPKLGTAIDKLSDVGTSIEKMIAVHETRINTTDTAMEKLWESFENHRKEDFSRFEEVKTSIETLGKETGDRQDKFRTEMTNMIEPLKKFVWKATAIVCAIILVIEIAATFLKNGMHF